jgi:DnaJ-class molecular chaperone
MGAAVRAMIVSPAKAAEAANVLGVELDTLTEDEVKKSYRDKAKDCHPDYHGNTQLQLWARISWAKDCLSHWLASRPQQQPEVEELARGELGNCRACGGDGRVKVVSSGFGKPLTMMCVMCRGSGFIEPEENDGE